LVLVVEPGKRTAENCEKVVQEVQKRTGGRTDIYFTSDEHAPYEGAIRKAYAQEVPIPKRTELNATKIAVRSGQHVNFPRTFRFITRPPISAPMPTIFVGRCALSSSWGKTVIGIQEPRPWPQAWRTMFGPSRNGFSSPLEEDSFFQTPPLFSGPQKDLSYAWR
jgi:hypothetical protein